MRLRYAVAVDPFIADLPTSAVRIIARPSELRDVPQLPLLHFPRKTHPHLLELILPTEGVGALIFHRSICISNKAPQYCYRTPRNGLELDLEAVQRITIPAF